MTSTTTAPEATARLALADDEVHVWHFAYRREQGRAPLLGLLTRYLGRTPGHVRLATGEHGRPRLDPPADPSLDFNWSHCVDHAVVAVARQLVPGIDIERLDERANALRLAQRYFHPAETAALAGLPASVRSAAFLEFWTAKEAVLKALGRGLAFGLHRLQVSRGPHPRLLSLDGENPGDWQLHRPPLDGRYVAALAWCGGPRRVVTRALDTDGAGDAASMP